MNNCIWSTLFLWPTMVRTWRQHIKLTFLVSFAGIAWIRWLRMHWKVNLQVTVDMVKLTQGEYAILSMLITTKICRPLPHIETRCILTETANSLCCRLQSLQTWAMTDITTLAFFPSGCFSVTRHHMSDSVSNMHVYGTNTTRSVGSELVWQQYIFARRIPHQTSRNSAMTNASCQKLCTTNTAVIQFLPCDYIPEVRS